MNLFKTSTKIAPRNDFLFLSSQFLYATIFSIPIWIAYYQTKISVSEVSLLVGIQYASQLLLELPTGAIADLLGRKFSSALGYFFWIVASIIIVFANGFPLLLLATLFGGLAEALLSGSLEALVYDSHKQDGTVEKFSNVLTKNNVLFQFGLAIGTISGGFIYQINPTLPYALYAILCFGSLILSFFMIEPSVDSEKFSFKSYIKQIRDGTKHAFAKKSVTLVSLYYIAVATITWTVNLYFFDFILLDLGFDPQTRGIIGAVIRIFNVLILASLLNNVLIFTKNRSIWFFPLTMIIGYLGAAILFDNKWAALPFIALGVMAGTARWIILTKYTNENFESKYRATAISALSMLIGIGYTIITFISGPIIQNFGGVKTMYYILATLTVITVLPLANVLTIKK